MSCVSLCSEKGFSFGGQIDWQGRNFMQLGNRSRIRAQTLAFQRKVGFRDRVWGVCVLGADRSGLNDLG